MLLLTIVIAFIFVIIILFIINSSYLTAIKKAQKNIILSLLEPVIIINDKNTVTIINSAAENILGRSAKDVIGHPIDDVLQLFVDQKAMPYAIYKDTADSERQQSVNFILKKPDGESTQIVLMIKKNAFGTKDQILISLLDTSKERQLEEMKVDFVSMAAHELRTPLTAIRGYASLLQMHYSNTLDESAKEMLLRLIVSTTNLTNLIDNLLSVSRIERNNMTVAVKPIDVSIIIKDIFSSFQQEAQAKKIQLKLNIPDTLPTVMADPFRIGQVFINLISNALNYTAIGGNVSVTVTEKDNNLEFSVRDNGEGIPKEAMPRLFTKFFRVSNSLEQGSKGTGLGLYITKSIVELHNGKIWAESTPGNGSVFTFTLPLATDEQKNEHAQLDASNNFLTVKNGQGIIIRKSLPTKE